MLGDNHQLVLAPGANTDSVISNVEILVQLNGCSFNCGLVAGPGQIFELQASVDLQHWVNLADLPTLEAA